MLDKQTPSILLVEDDPDVALLFKRTFAKECSDWRIVHAENGLLAIDWIMSCGLPAAVITDLKMPAMNGFELIAWIRAGQHAHKAPIYVISSSLDEATVDRCRHLGANAFIPKLCCADDLRPILRQLFPPAHVDRLLLDAGFDGETLISLPSPDHEAETSEV